MLSSKNFNKDKKQLINRGTRLDIFFMHVYNHNFEEAFSVLTTFYNKSYASDNLYLYLLNMVCDLPDDYKRKVRSLKLKDIQVNNFSRHSKYGEIVSKVRENIFNKKFVDAHNSLLELKRVMFPKTLAKKDEALFYLVSAAQRKKETYKKHILFLSKAGCYEELITYLSSLYEDRKLDIIDSYVLMIAKDIVSAKKKNIVPNVVLVDTSNIFKAIRVKDYGRAMSLVVAGNRGKDMDNLQSSLYISLYDAIDSIYSVVDRPVVKTKNKKN